ncbi:helix-turn-helix transcriptional regulator [Thalassospira marina]|uniref:Transcriptional regulator n=1 Tax=Thalassospira marina TaxID=2048283 RepID=A0ABN5FMS5_9PROT|nr:YafY family protein [Thalassospira marina]AUG53764.1 transcriptional regulator [Thalassospira marina]
MAKSERLLQLMQALRVLPSPVTAHRLAEEMDVSLRTIYRDIDSLRVAGARIEGERGFGYQLTEDYALPPQTLTRIEIEALALGLGEIKCIGDPMLADAAASVLAKVAATLPSEREQQLFHAISKIYRPQPRFTFAIDIAPIRTACWNEQAVKIDYQDHNNDVSTRVIYPLSLMYTERKLTILSWCCKREDFRMFRTDRILAVEITDISFRPKRVSLLNQYLAKLTARETED